MTAKNKILLACILSLTILMVAFSFYRYFVSKNYFITTTIACDPEEESCFVSFCDIEEDSTCPEDPDEAISFYKIIEKKAKNMPDCDPNSEDCVLGCAADAECSEILCSVETVEAEEECSTSIEENSDEEVLFEEEGIEIQNTP